MTHGNFVTMLNCMDGRAHPPVTAWLQQNLENVDFVDRITEPGIDGVLVAGSAAKLAEIRNQIDISLNAHGSRVIALVGHHDCAGNPVSREEHLRQIDQGVSLIQSWGLPVRVIGLWVNDQWQVEKVRDTAS